MLFVLAVGFLIPVIVSFSVFFGKRHSHPATQHALFFTVLYQLFGILCLYLVLKHQKMNFANIGFSPSLRVVEVGHSFALFFAALFLSVITYPVLSVVLSHALGHGFPKADHSAIFGSSIGVFTILFVFLNPFHEELLVRAFLITEIEGLYRSTNLAIIASIALQISYHFYQGLPAAMSHIPAFWLFSVYFVRTRRISPVILAHLFMDVTGLSIYAHGLH